MTQLLRFVNYTTILTLEAWYYPFLSMDTRFRSLYRQKFPSNLQNVWATHKILLRLNYSEKVYKEPTMETLSIVNPDYKKLDDV